MSGVLLRKTVRWTTYMQYEYKDFHQPGYSYNVEVTHSSGGSSDIKLHPTTSITFFISLSFLTDCHFIRNTPSQGWYPFHPVVIWLSPNKKRG